MLKDRRQQRWMFPWLRSQPLIVPSTVPKAHKGGNKPRVAKGHALRLRGCMQGTPISARTYKMSASANQQIITLHAPASSLLNLRCHTQELEYTGADGQPLLQWGACTRKRFFCGTLRSKHCKHAKSTACDTMDRWVGTRRPLGT